MPDPMATAPSGDQDRITDSAADWAIVTGDATGWVWLRDDFWARLRRVLICQRFHSWALTLEGSRRTCAACRVRKATT